jgi:hypothetical protein
MHTHLDRPLWVGGHGARKFRIKEIWQLQDLSVYWIYEHVRATDPDIIIRHARAAVLALEVDVEVDLGNPGQLIARVNYKMTGALLCEYRGRI